MAAEGVPGLGMHTDFIGRDPAFNAVNAKLSTDEMMVLALVGKSAQIGEVLTRSGLAEDTAVAALKSLRGKGAIRPTMGAAPPSITPSPLTPPPRMTPPPPAPIDASRPSVTPAPMPTGP